MYISTLEETALSLAYSIFTNDYIIPNSENFWGFYFSTDKLFLEYQKGVSK